MNGRRATGALVLFAAAALFALAPASVTAQSGGEQQGKIKTRSATGTNSGQGAVITQIATCPKKTRAVGGGFTGTPASAAAIPIVFESRKLGQRQWRASSQINDPGPATSISLTAFVYCRAGAPKTSEAATTVGTPDANGVGPSAIATCPGRRNALAGGFATPPPLGGLTIARVLTAESRRVGDASWEALGVTTAGAGGSSLTALAYCAKQDPPAARAGVGSPNGAQVTSSTTSASCKAKERAVAGGFAQPGAQANTPIRIFIPYESRRTGNGWQAAGLLTATAGVPPGTFNAFAYCA
jgi:hypothetical protein